MINMNFEIKSSINNVLNSEFSTKEISEKCDISPTTINELRSKKREISNTSFQNALSLYQFAVNNRLNQQFLLEEEKKGTYSFISLGLNISKVIVSFEEYDLLAYGILNNRSRKVDSPDKRDKLVAYSVSTAVFITREGHVYDCEEFGYQFKCRYGGTGPNNFVDFLEKYTKISKEELKKVVFNNSVVEYNFENDTISGYPAVIEGRPFRLFTFNEKMILLLDKYDNSSLALGRNNLNLKDAANDIKFLVSKLSESYNISTKIKDITYIPKSDQDNITSIKQLPNYKRLSNGVSIVIDYGNFEFWLTYRIHQNKGDIFKSEEMIQLLDGLGLTYNMEKKNFIQAYFDAKEPIEKATKLSVEYEDDYDSEYDDIISK